MKDDQGITDVVESLAGKINTIEKNITRLNKKFDENNILFEGIPELLSQIESRLNKVEDDLTFGTPPNESEIIIHIGDDGVIIPPVPSDEPWRSWDVELARPSSVEHRLEILEDKTCLLDNLPTDDDFNDFLLKLKNLEKKVSEKNRMPKPFLEILKRVKSAKRIDSKLQKIPLTHSLKAEDLVNLLQAKDFYISLKTAHEIISSLETHRLLVLEGAPGTGKTTLAGLLPRFFFPDYTYDLYTLASVHPLWSENNSIGGMCKIGEHFGPKLGKITEAVLNSIENNGCHWLVLDEINRGDVNSYLSPLLAGMNIRDGFITHDYINLFESSKAEEKILMPGRFRIIGTMNNVDKDQLFEFNAALRERTRFVKIDHPSEEEERKLIDKLILPEVIDEIISQSIILDRDKVEQHINSILDQFFIFVKRIRKISNNKPKSIFQFTDIGTRMVFDLVRSILIDAIYDSRNNNQLLSNRTIEIIDKSVANVFIERFPVQNLDLYQTMLLKVFNDEKFIMTKLALENKIEKLRFY